MCVMFKASTLYFFLSKPEPSCPTDPPRSTSRRKLVPEWNIPQCDKHPKNSIQQKKKKYAAAKMDKIAQCIQGRRVGDDLCNAYIKKKKLWDRPSGWFVLLSSNVKQDSKPHWCQCRWAPSDWMASLVFLFHNKFYNNIDPVRNTNSVFIFLINTFLQIDVLNLVQFGQLSGYFVDIWEIGFASCHCGSSFATKKIRNFFALVFLNILRKLLL